MPFKQVRVSPVLDLDAYANDEALFDLIEIELPVHEACLLRNITVVDKLQVNANALDLQLLFLNSNDNAIKTDQHDDSLELTAIQASRSVTGFCHYKNATQSADADFDTFNITSTTDNKLTTSFNNPILLQPKEGGRSIFFTAVSVSETPTFNGATGVLVNGAVSAGASDTVAVDTVSALLHFRVGQTVVDADDNVVGVIKSLTATSIVFESVTGEALANNDELFTPHHLEFIFDFEYSLRR